MCILLKLDYAKFGVSSLFFSNVVEEKPFFRGEGTPLGRRRVKNIMYLYILAIHLIQRYGLKRKKQVTPIYTNICQYKCVI